MAERNAKRRNSKLSRNPSTESADESNIMGRSIKEKRHKKPKERWLLTRKTWRYMADAGRKLIPEGVHNRPEDVPKIEAYFQEVCKREPNFLLWRKNSYPGALGFRSKKRKDRRKGGSCRKANSSDEIEFLKPERPKDLALKPTTAGRFDIQRMKYDFLNEPYVKKPGQTTPEEIAENQLLEMLEKYLVISNGKDKLPSAGGSSVDLNYQELIDKLQRHLTVVSQTTQPYVPTRRQQVHFEGDHVQKSLAETLSRYFSQYSNRDRVISDLLTDRKALEKLYFELRQTKGFRSRGYSPGHTPVWSSTPLRKSRTLDNSTYVSPPPLIEIHSESLEPTFENWGIQTDKITDETLQLLEDEYQKLLAEREEEAREFKSTATTNRRRSSVDNDDISQSVSDTIKRYLRMARKKSVDSNKSDRFKRVNYDRNLRNIKAKGEITKPGDDDGLNKGCQTDECWITGYKEYAATVRTSRGSFDASEQDKSPTNTHSGFLSNLSNLLHGKYSQDKSSSPANTIGAMQKSKSSSSVGSRLVAKKIFRSRSKSQTRNATTQSSWAPQEIIQYNIKYNNELRIDEFTSEPQIHKEIDRAGSQQKYPLLKMMVLDTKYGPTIKIETPEFFSFIPNRYYQYLKEAGAKKIQDMLNQGRPIYILSMGAVSKTGGCVWNSTNGRQVVLGDTTLLQLSEIERKVLQKVAIAKLQALNLGINVKIPTDSAVSPQKPKRRAYLLKRKAITTSFFDANRKDGDKDKEAGSGSSGQVFGIPLSQCVENDRLARLPSGSASPAHTESPVDDFRRHRNRASFSSLIDAARDEEIGSCENIRLMGSVPGLLDSISCGSTTDIVGTTHEDEPAIPNILNECLRFLENNGLHTVGIFRVSTSKKRVRQLREEFDSGKDISLGNDQCPHDVATLLKEYLRDLPDPLLCRDLYQAFVQTQKIRNRRLQLEALEHLVQLLPTTNRDTLWTLLNFLATVARFSENQTDPLGEILSGNKMDANNLATVFAPNILHCNKPGGKETTERPEDRIDIISVIRTLIDNNKQLFNLPAELLDEVYVHMMDSHPEALDYLLNKRILASGDDYIDDADSECNSAPLTPTFPTAHMTIEHLIATDSDGYNTAPEPRKTYSREEFLHESAATGGPNIGMRLKHKDRIRERSAKSTARRKKDEEGVMNIISRLRGQKEDEASRFNKLRSSSLDSNSSTQNDAEIQRGLRVCEEDRRKSIPYDFDSHGVITASLTIPVQTGNQPLSLNVDHSDIPFIEDGSATIRRPDVVRRRQHSTSGSDSSLSTIQPVTGSISIIQGYDSAISSSATVSSPPPSSIASSIAELGSPPSWASTPPTSPDSTHISVNYIPDDVTIAIKPIMSAKPAQKTTPVLQKVSFTSTPEIKHTKQADTSPKAVERQQRFTPSITSIGNAVLRSRTADFERIAKTEAKAKTPPNSDKKKYTKRRYTDSKHLTRHIPDSEMLEASSRAYAKENSSAQAGPVYKRREIISSVPSK